MHGMNVKTIEYINQQMHSIK